MDLAIQDFVIPQDPKTATRISIKITELNFGVSVKFNVFFYMSEETYDMNVAKVETVLIEGDEYKGWKDDDQYIIDLICSKLGLKQKEII